MRHFYLSVFFIIASLAGSAQYDSDSLELIIDPGYFAPFYSKSVKQDSVWHRQLWYSREGTLYMDGFYKDEQHKVPHGKFYWFYSNKNLLEQAEFVNGLREGLTLKLSQEGYLTDSIIYKNGYRSGIGYKWHINGMIADSAHFDGKGNGVIVSWDADGMLKSAGHYKNDTSKIGRWKHFHPNGVTSAIIDYKDGEITNLNCFDKAGKPLQNCESRDPAFIGGASAWRKYLERTLNPMVPIDNAAPSGSYTVIVEFVVDVDGSLSDFKALTKHGYGMEQEAIRVIMKSGKWDPLIEFGSTYRSVRKQPLTFVISGF